jgi:hypothetical protein
LNPGIFQAMLNSKIHIGRLDMHPFLKGTEWFNAAASASSVPMLTGTLAITVTALILRFARRISTTKCFIIVAVALFTFTAAYVVTDYLRESAFHHPAPGSRTSFM